jgi:hypothetical protein
MALGGRSRRGLLAVALLVLAACTDTNDPAAPTSSSTTSSSTSWSSTTSSTEPAPEPQPQPVSGLVAEIGTNRLYAVDRAFGLALHNLSDEPIVVEAMQLDSPLFAFAPPTERRVTLSPGRRLVLALPYGEVRCDDEPGPTFPVAVTLEGGEVVHLDAAEEYDGAVARLHERECAAADVLERVDISFGEAWVQDGIATTGELRLEQRHAGEPVAIDDAVGNVIFTLVVADAHPVLAVSDDEPSATIPVTIRADRCDPHAVAEFKTPYLFLSWVTVGDGDPVPVPLELTGAARQALETLIATCSV